MPNPPKELLEYVLRACGAAAPQPWYPSSFQEPGVSRDLLDATLDQLRLGGLVRLTDWVKERGQGYALTPEGAAVLGDAGLLGRLRQGGMSAAAKKPEPLGRPESTGTPWARGEAVRAALLERPKPIVTLTLLALNIFVFLSGLVLATQHNISVHNYLGWGDNKVLNIRHDMGAMAGNDVLVHGQWWRLLTSAFVHHGIIHILMNMYFLFSLGPLVEAMWGRWRYLLLYLTSALGGGVAALLYSDPRALYAGASGALCGLLASMPVWVLLNRPYLPRELASNWLSNITTNIVLIVIISMLPGISAAGHFGGGLAGAAIAFPMVWERFEHSIKRVLGLAGTLAVPLVLVAIVYSAIHAGPVRDAGGARSAPGSHVASVLAPSKSHHPASAKRQADVRMQIKQFYQFH
jgi:membrane associated rhomboid family serine protease